jgi:pSer/pThr/pTyr-binding forkhead associated (FHA) protein
MPAQLLALNDGPSILLDKPILLIGRHPECDIQIDSRKISRRHCCIAQVNDYLVVRDLGSTNGIRINGERVAEGRLKAGDELVIGQNRFRVQWDSLEDRPGYSRPPSQFLPRTPTPSEAARSAIRRKVPVPDDLLEDCDDPVPLSEGEEDRRFPPGVAAPDTSRAIPDADNDDDDPLSSHERPILPDELDLAPASDILPRPPFPPPP